MPDTIRIVMSRCTWPLFMMVWACRPEQKEMVFHPFHENGEDLHADHMESAFNHLHYIGKDSVLYDLDKGDKKPPYHFFCQPLMIPEGKDSLDGVLKSVPFQLLVDTSSTLSIG